jgi:membrane associated rhomboid family serine protease
MTPAPVGLRCPEHSGKPQGVQKVTRNVSRIAAGRANAVTMGLILLNVLVYAVELAGGGALNGTNNWLFNHGALFVSATYTQGGAPVGVAHGEWWRLLTAAFLHYGPLHLLLNMYSLYWVGTLLEQVIGSWRFLLLYLAAGIAGSAGALLLTPNAITVGASGAIFGVLGALYVLERQGRIHSGGQIMGLIVLNLVITFAFSGFAIGSHVTGLTISLGGHLGGLIGGFVLMMLMMRFRRNALYCVLSALGVIAVSVAIAYFKTRGYA